MKHKMLGKSLTLLYNRQGNPTSLTTHSPSTAPTSYVVAFPMRTLAVRAQKYVQVSSQLRLEPSVVKDVSSPIHEGLFEMGIDPRAMALGTVLIDETAQLHVSKKININHTMCTMIDRAIEEIILYPFTHNVGLVLPVELMEDAVDELVFEAQVVEPCGNAHLMKKMLMRGGGGGGG